MSIYWPHKEEDIVAERRLHALVIGVGEYDHLGLGVAKPARVVGGLPPLSTTPLSAVAVARWLETKYTNARCERGSIELLLSPGAPALPRFDGTTVAIEKATMSNIKEAVKRWYARCNSDPDNTAFLYFAGHGLSTMIGHLLLPADFGNPDLTDAWENAIDSDGLRVGMKMCKAQTQLYFIDACRDYNMSVLQQHSPKGQSLVAGASVNDRVAVSATFLAAAEGRQAYGLPDEETFFCKALIACLEGAGARKPGSQWQVDAASLGGALPAVLAAMAKAANQPLSCECRVQKSPPIHFPLNGAVVVQVECTPDTINAEAAITVTQGASVLTSKAGEPRPWLGHIAAGDATIEVQFANYDPEHVQTLMSPPTYELEVVR